MMPANVNDRPRRPWLILPWETDEQVYAVLLDALTRERLETNLITREMEATSRRSMAELQEDHAEIVRDELAGAREELGHFRAALLDARARGGADGRDEVAYDSADPTEDRYADVLIQYLVRTEHAEVRTEEVGQGHFVYHVRIDWDRLRRLAEEQGQQLQI